MPGFLCDYLLYPDDGISVVLLTNQDFGGGTDPVAMSRGVAMLYRPDLPG